MPVYRRADLSRTITLVVALFLAAASTSAFAREFRAADTQNGDYPTVQVLLYQALLYMGSMVAECGGGLHQIKVGIYARAQRDPAAGQLIERIRKVA